MPSTRLNTTKNPKVNKDHDKLLQYTVYCISSERANICYIGSTRRQLKSRLSEHRHDATHTATRGDKSSRLVLREPDHKITVLETGTCTRDNKDYILLREMYFMKNYDGNICNDRDAIEKSKLRGIIRKDMNKIISLAEIFKDT